MQNIREQYDLSYWSQIFLTLSGLLGLESNYWSKNKGWQWDWVLRRICTVLHSNCLRGAHYTFLRQCSRVNPLRRAERLRPLKGGKPLLMRSGRPLLQTVGRVLPLAKKKKDTLEFRGSVSKGSVSLVSSGYSQQAPIPIYRSYSFPVNAFT